MAKSSKPTGCPTGYNEKIAAKICRAISVDTRSLKDICKDNPEFPVPSCIHGWRLDYPEFGDKYDRAKRIQADLLAEEILSIADNKSEDTIIEENKDGVLTATCNKEWIQRSRLMVDTRKWIACKLLPKVYGEKQQIDAYLTDEKQESWVDRLK